MREWTSAIFWVVTGGVIAFGGLALMSIGLPFLVVGLVMAVFGMFSLKFKGVWGITIGLGVVPAYDLLRQVWEAKVFSETPCTQEGEATLGAPSGPGESDVVSSCSPPCPRASFPCWYSSARSCFRDRRCGFFCSGGRVLGRGDRETARPVHRRAGQAR